MRLETANAALDGTDGMMAGGVACTVRHMGGVVALAGLVLPLLLISDLKFTPLEAALKLLIGGTLWLAWTYPVFGEAGASYLLGAVEIATALLLIASLWSPWAGVVGGALGGLTFLLTT